MTNLREHNKNRWNQAKSGSDCFSRTYCPICGSIIKSDNGYGSFEISKECDSVKNHYTYSMSLFGKSVRILGKSFEADKVDEIELYLDDCGNKAFK